MSNIPALDKNKDFSLGLGLGYFAGQPAYALGFNMRRTESLVFRGSIATDMTTNAKPTVGLGAAVAW